MLIEQVEALKSWLTQRLSPICDAEPSALAKYVCALVKKDKPEQDLKDICTDQLDVFLQLKTKPFVEELFESLKTKSYIPPSEKKTVPGPAAPVKRDTKSPARQGEKEKDETIKKKQSEISSTTDEKDSKEAHTSKESKDKEPTGAGDATIFSKEPTSREVREPRALSREGRDRDGERDRRDSWKDERNKDGIRDARDIIRERERDVPRDRDTREVREPRDRDHRDREKDFRRRRTRSRSFSPRRRDFDDRIRRRYDDRPLRHSPDRRWGRRRSWSRSPRRRSPIDRPLGRLRSRSPRLRSRSPRLRSRSPRERFRSFRSRTRSRSRSPGPRSWSRPGSVGARAGSPSNIRQPDSRGSTPVQDNDYSTLISSSTNDLPAITSTVGLRPTGDNKLERPPPMGPGPRGRCINFEEKGYCVLGDMCPYDHGTNPVVVEDVPITNVLAGGRPVPGPGIAGPGFIPPDLRFPPPVHMTVRMNMRQPPPNLVEPYLPEAPGLRQPLRPPFLRGMGPHIRPPPPHHPGIVMNRPPHDPMFPPHREVIIGQLAPPPPESDDLDTLIVDKEPSRIVIPSKRPFSSVGGDAMDPSLGPPPPRMAHINQNHHMFIQRGAPPFQPRFSHPGKKGFDYNRLGGAGGGFRQHSKPGFKTGNLTLEVRKIPQENNNIAKINEHFGKFGNLTNIQVKYQGDPGAALISFSNNGEATAAYKSPEPVFNNRFIKLFWHDSSKSGDGGDSSGTTDSKDVSGGTGIVRSGGRVGDGIDHPSLVLPPRPAFPPSSKLQLDNTKPKVPGSSNESTPSAEQTFVYSSSFGHMKKTVHNPAAPVPVKAKSATGLTSPTATAKPSDFVSRIEAIKRAEESKKKATVKQAELDAKKQDLLAKQIQQQKLLIETLDKKKGTMSEKERANLLKSLKSISDSIDIVKYGTGSKKAVTAQAPPMAQLRFVSQEQAHAKEMQELEQEVMARQKKGEDTTALRTKLMELANKQQPTGFPYGRGRGWSAGRGSTWAPRGRGRGAAASFTRTLDNRPKTLEVKNFDLDEIEELKAHFQQFGELEKVDLMEDPPSLWITYTSRPNAEMAITQGSKFSNKMLSLKWYEPQKLSQRESIQSSDLDDEDLSVSLGSIEEEALLNFKSEDKATPADGEADARLPVVTESSGDSRSVVASQEEEEQGDSLTAVTAATYQRTLSEDLMLGDEQNFKASYTDDEDDDNITVTVSNTVNSGSWVFSESGADLLEEEEGIGKGEELEDSADLDNLANSEITFTEDDGSSWV